MKPACISEEEFHYCLLSKEAVITSKREMDAFTDKVKEKLELDSYDIEINYPLLCTMFIRVDERADYFMYFHSKEEVMHMSRRKEIALQAFWISKYKPFRLRTVQQEAQFFRDYRCSINEVIAVMLMVGYLCEEDESLKMYFTAKKINTLIYDMFNRDISKEALIMYVDSYLPDEVDEEGGADYGVGPGAD